ncbi:MAG: MurR/RpiR family transcriptional regulator [Bariatricus sp.]
MNDLFVKMRFLLPSLPRAEKAIAEALLENPEAITHMTLAEIAREAGSSEASTIRFCKRMGYSGYSEMKADFARALAEGTELQPEGVEASDDMLTILKKVYQSNIQTMSDTLVLANGEYEEALEALLKARSIHFFGAGDAHAVCQLAYMKFKRLGIPCSAEGDVMLQMITAGNMKKDDVAIAISYEGRSKNVVEALKIAKQMGATTISITKMNKSPLLKYTDIKLFIAVNDLSIGRDKVTRRVSDQFIIDALYLGYATRAGKNSYKEQLRRTQIAIDGNKI